MTSDQEALLKDLLRNPTWTSLLEDLEKSREIKPWKPGKAENTDDKTELFIYESGVKRGVTDIIAMLRLGK